MNCDDFENNVNDLAREQMMETSVRARALAHRDECEACAERLADESALSLRLRALATDTNSAKPPPPRSELMGALRSHQVAVTRTLVVTRSRYWTATGAAVAAMILLMIAIAVVRSRSATPIAQSSSESASQLNGSPDEGSVAKGPVRIDGSESALLPHKNPSFRSRRAGKNIRGYANRSVVMSQSIANAANEVTTAETVTNTDSNAAELVTDFLPVGYANAANLQDGGQLVRLELPRSALVAFGLPINFNRYDEKVKADVFFGADGMARAIRFVQ